VQAPARLATLTETTCTDGFAGPYPCRDVDLLSYLSHAEMGGGSGNDIWGWTDPETGREYALVGESTGTAFVDISTPSQPLYLGALPTHTAPSAWRGIKVFANHAFVVSEAVDHGMQVFDLTQLRTVTAPPVTFSETAHYAGFGSTHTIALNTRTLDEEAARQAIADAEAETGLVADDPVRFGAGRLLDAVLAAAA